MLVLFVCELQAFLRTEVYSTVMLDTNKDNKLRINFNITMLALPCEYARSQRLALGTLRQSLPANVRKQSPRETRPVALDEEERGRARLSTGTPPVFPRFTPGNTAPR